ncbi:MAG: thioredoxin domain-containing protein [Bryobacteraceae bacterium]
MNKLFRYARYMAIPLALALPAAAQMAAGQTPKDEGITHQQAEDILKELRQIRELLEKQQSKGSGQPDAEQPARAKLNLAGFQMLGDKDAPLTMVEFTDYQCPFCRQFHETTYSQLKKEYIDAGKLRFYSRDLPLDFHPNAMRAAEAARCAAEQGKFWQLRDIMGANPDKLEMADLVADATGLRMDIAAFRSCVEGEKYKNAIQTDVLEAMKIGATGTPTFVVGKSTAEGVDGEVVLGALPYAMFDQKLKEIK